MSSACTSCGHSIPAGQFRCGKCGAAQANDEFDESGLGVLSDPLPLARDPLAGATALAEVAVSSKNEDPNGARESLVPRGTFASEGPPQPSREAEAQLTSSATQAAAQPAPGREATKAAPDQTGGPAKATTSSSQRMRVARCPQRPPYLASEILRDDIAPLEPGQHLLAVVVSVSSVAGLVGALLAGLETYAAVGLAAVFAALLASGRLKLTYSLRATIVSALSGLTLSLVLWYRVARGAPLSDVLLIASTTVLPAALHFRAWYRGSLTARALVGLSLVPAVTWALLTMHRQLLSLEFVWQSWLPALVWYLFVICCLLALLAFMGDESTGGCTAWALGIGVWFALYACVRYALESNAPQAMRTLGLAEPALAAPCAVGLAQLLARTLGLRGRRAVQVAPTAS